ncbi:MULTISPECIES: metabolite traffic protein EboE [unclassified Nodularia (in: cyanobacteria)]|uniref:metabolite traffic protein EboE n=1 Tax=unclassified Nodularia (in: cyanobacteria) TaxID=2656917 RepID=UPI00187F9B27|nr:MULTISPECIES: metabolite traffic protein EboE [unclassified Nodularia (in: cyanobacteria)]MBE9200920.1 metabolite traffic protein EboE [Nodularia sp. LEGE 06071]MCC2692412.1 metabolite traffic protein EboE [Nodularia sp. LEGE 04288]
MKLGSNNNFDLTYCTNIHSGEEWDKVFANLKQYIPPLKAKVAPGKSFGIGLRLAAVAARELLEGKALTQFQSWLTEEGLYVFTLNGFPYGKFHREVVKDQVYAPNWTQPERLEYTLQLTEILAALLPTDTEGSISTLPLSYKPWYEGNQLVQASVMDSASLQIAQVVAQMVDIRNQQRKLLHLDLEPEPDGLIENADEVVNYFQKHLLPVGGAYLVKHLGISPILAEKYLLDHVRICYDTCHFAVEYENPISVFQQFQAAGIQIGKIQISAALQVNLSEDTAQRRLVGERLRPFAESTYLHQVIAREQNNRLIHYPDLENALPHLENTNDCEWRIHFHVPIFIHDYHLLQSTQDDISTVLNLLRDNNTCAHLEIETYTWEVLPEAMKLDLLASIQREYEWVQTKFLTKQLVS